MTYNRPNYSELILTPGENSSRFSLSLEMKNRHNLPRYVANVPHLQKSDGTICWPNARYIQPGYTPHLKADQVINGIRVSYFEYPAARAHRCQIEIVDGPSWLVGWVSPQCRGKHAHRARTHCIDQLKRAITNNAPPQVPVVSLQDRIIVNQVMSDVSSDNMLLLDPDEVPEMPSLDVDSGVTPLLWNSDEASVRILEMPLVDPEESTPAKWKEGLEPVMKDPIEDASKKMAEGIRDEWVGKEPQKRKENPSSEEKGPPQKKSKLEGGGSKPKLHPVKELRKFGKEHLASGREKVQKGQSLEKEAFSKFQKLEAFENKIAQSESGNVNVNIQGKKVTLTNDQAQKLLQKQQVRVSNIYAESVKLQTVGKAQAVVGRATTSGTKQLKKELQGAANALGGSCGAATMTAILNFEQYENPIEAIKEIGSETINSTVNQGVKNVVINGLRGAAKEVLPNVPIPGVNTIQTCYTLGNALVNSSSPEEAMKNVANAGADIGISLGCTAVGQALIPVPFLGSFIGSMAGTFAIYGKNQLVESWSKPV